MKKASKIIGCICLFVSLICFFYFVFLEIKLGCRATFNYVWLLAAIVFLSIYLVNRFAYSSISKVPKPVKYIIEIIVLVSFLLFIIVEAIIIFSHNNDESGDVDYIVVLGAKTYDNKPSLILQYRIEKAYEYYLEHPNAKFVASGGQGSDESISEAQMIKMTLLDIGVNENDIILEDKSLNTEQNLRNTKEIIGDDCSIAIVSNDFHVFRACKIANKMGYKDVYGIKAKSVWYLIPTNYVREFVGVMKDFILGNL